MIPRQQDDSRRDELGIVEVIEIGDAIPPKPLFIDATGKPTMEGAGTLIDRFGVIATRHNRNWPGTDSPVTFAVEGYGWKDRFYGVVFMWGFFDEQSCYDFLNGQGQRQYPVWDQYGTPGMSEPRTLLGIRDAYIRRYKDEAAC